MSQGFNVFFKHASVGCSAQFVPSLRLGSSIHAISIWLAWWIFLEVPSFSLSCSFVVFSSCLPSLSLNFLFFFPLHLVHSSSLLEFFSSFLAFFLDTFGLFDPTSEHVHMCSALTLSIDQLMNEGNKEHSRKGQTCTMTIQHPGQTYNSFVSSHRWVLRCASSKCINSLSHFSTASL